MAYSFGGGVRPELGKTDYSGYLQGALTGAQGVAAGGAAIGQGIANLGAGIGEGIKKYQQNKFLQAEIMGGVEENIDFLTKNNPNFIKEAPPEVQKIMGRMADGKGVSVSQSAYLKSWSDSTTKQAKLNIENNAFASAIAFNEDGIAPTGQQAAMRYFAAGGQDNRVIGSLLAYGNNALEVEALEKRIIGQGLANDQTQQGIEGTTPITPFQKRQLENQSAEIAARQAAADAAAARQAAADERDKKRLNLSIDASERAENAAVASKNVDEDKKDIENITNKAIGLFQADKNAYDEFFKGLPIEKQGVVLSFINQFERGIPKESALTPSAIADLLTKRDSNKGPTLAEYISSINSVNISKTTESKFVVPGMFNDIKRIPAFDQLLKQFPQLNTGGSFGGSEIKLPGGGSVRTIKE
jgi:hypothetical protein